MLLIWIISGEMTAEDAYKILKNISDEDGKLLGFDPKYARPEWMIVTVLPVPPLAVRPAITMDSNSTAHDDLTHSLSQIADANIQLKKHRQDGSPAMVVSEALARLQVVHATYIDNELNGIKSEQKSGRPLRTLRQRLKAKEGRIR
eukprot:Pgem_evm1s1390